MESDTASRPSRPSHRASALVLVIMVAGMISTLSISQAHAQQSGQRSAAQTSAGAGADGAAGTKGSGSGGASAGAMSGQGGVSGISAGPGSVNQHRSGGPTAPEPPAPPPPPPGAETDLPALADSTGLASLGTDASEIYVLGRGGRCEGHELGHMSVQERVRGANRNRLDTIQHYLAPGFQPDDMQTPIYILANYQQELESTRPNLTLAGTYLGLVATRPITADVVAEVNNALCLATADVQAATISQTAEAQRLSAQ